MEYEGEFLFNRKYNGKWYDKNGNIIYELINGKGKVKKYDFVGKLLFVGEYFNGKKHGKGKEYFRQDKLIFEGEYLNGKKHGKGKEYYFDGGIIFEGEFLNDKRIEKK